MRENIDVWRKLPLVLSWDFDFISIFFLGSIALYYSDDIKTPYKTPSAKQFADAADMTGMAMGKYFNLSAVHL